jgi:acetyl-CoA carboxylase biotin carboxylase subunit
MTLLIANRGEIAVRVIRACRELGIRAVAVYAACDRAALHVRLADEAYEIGEGPAAGSYLRIDRILGAARRAGATLVHPGYGFLSENAAFAEACQGAGLTFVGPTAAAIRRMGDKHSAREAARAAGVPVVAGTNQPFAADAPDEALAAAADAVGFPILVKAVAGGGGKGMRSVTDRRDLAAAVRLARSEALSAFGDGTVYFERRLEAPRHIEVQILADAFGAVVPFVERECSIQRRHQKVVEESPSPVVDPTLRRAIADAAAAVARASGYTNAGTIEFLVDAEGRFSFLEMNTRLQVEHPITEAVTGVDLVAWQIRIALGERLTIDGDRALAPRGHAVECRVYAEDPDRGFLPAPGLVRALHVPSGPGIRDDRGIDAGFEIPVFYDSLIAKLIVWGEDRPAALARLRRAVDEYRVVGVPTTIPFFRWLVRQPEFAAARFDTTYLDRVLSERRGRPFAEPSATDIDEAAFVAGLHAWFTAGARGADAGVGAGAGEWRRAARREALR